MIDLKTTKKREQLFHFSILAVAIIIAYFRIFHAGFIDWDDNDYVVHNKDITAFGLQNISAWFSKFYIGNYQPLTLFSYAVDYLIGVQNPLIYHFTNLLLHIANSILLYLFFSKIQQNRWVAFFTALLFALHPSQTENVSWIAERKTLLCALFYFLALLQYVKYVSSPVFRNFWPVIVLAAAAMLSKGVGVAMPLALFAIDIWLGRDLKTKKPWLEKVPIFLFAIGIGIIAIKAQASAQFLGIHPDAGIWNTLVFAADAYVQYILNLFVPLKLSVIYPYPQFLGIIEYLYLIIAFGVLAFGILAYRKGWNMLCGGIVFYSVNIVFLLQFISFGEVLMADRYLYIASAGILFPAVYYLFELIQKRKMAPIVLGSFTCLVLLTMTFIRNEIWLSDFNFFSAILDVFPNSAVAQYSVGGLYMRQGNYPEAEIHMKLAIEDDPGNYKAWYNIGALYLREGKPKEALDALNKCLDINDFTKAHFSRALLYQGTGRPGLALTDAQRVLDTQPQNARAWYIKGDCTEQTGNLPEALDCFNKAIENEDSEPLFYIRRGLIYAKTNQSQPALNDLEKAVALNPSNGEAYYYRGIVKYRSGQNPCKDFHYALNHGYKDAQAAIENLCNQPQGGQ